MKKILKIVSAIIIMALLVVAGYFAYVITTYSRIEDFLELEATGVASWDGATVGQEYTVVSQNIGFGAYTADFTFFMDGGTESRAASRDSVLNCINQAVNRIKSYNPDIVLFQEVDFDSTRSYHTDQREILREAFSGFCGTYARNYHSAYLMYPVLEPHGKNNSGMLTLSNMNITEGLRRSFPIPTDFSKFLDLDRAYSINRISMDNGKELVVYNVHASAYATSGDIRSEQMSMLLNDMQKEYNNGNYCIAGGDFNADFTGNSVAMLNNGIQSDMGWAQPFPVNLLTDNLNVCVDYTKGILEPTCRNCDVPYEEGNFTIIVDGFIISDNIEMTYLENVQTGFVYSDHNPVVMKFVLKD